MCALPHSHPPPCCASEHPALLPSAPSPLLMLIYTSQGYQELKLGFSSPTKESFDFFLLFEGPGTAAAGALWTGVYKTFTFLFLFLLSPSAVTCPFLNALQTLRDAQTRLCTAQNPRVSHCPALSKQRFHYPGQTLHLSPQIAQNHTQNRQHCHKIQM